MSKKVGGGGGAKTLVIGIIFALFAKYPPPPPVPFSAVPVPVGSTSELCIPHGSRNIPQMECSFRSADNAKSEKDSRFYATEIPIMLSSILC